MYDACPSHAGVIRLLLKEHLVTVDYMFMKGAEVEPYSLQYKWSNGFDHGSMPGYDGISNDRAGAYAPLIKGIAVVGSGTPVHGNEELLQSFGVFVVLILDDEMFAQGKLFYGEKFKVITGPYHLRC